MASVRRIASIYPDGPVEFEGIQNVPACGRRIRHIDVEEYHRPSAAFGSAHFLSADLPKARGIRITDRDTALVAVEVSGRFRVFVHYAPEHYRSPLTELARLVDEVSKVYEWSLWSGDHCRCKESASDSLEQLLFTVYSHTDGGVLSPRH